MDKASKTCVVVIPIYSETPSQNELISLRQCYAVLGRHAIKVIAPEGLNLSSYHNAGITMDVIYIHPKWQSTLLWYNKLKVSRFFYNLFKDYEYLLTYELDAFVFSDELLYWCAQGYDYIGAPWFKNYMPATPSCEFEGVGNSGFSLRKVSSMQYILKHIYYPPQFVVPLSLKEKIMERLKFPFRMLMNCSNENYTIQRYFNSSEDLFFATFVPANVKGFNIAPVREAMKFSMEVSPEVSYELNERKLPFGCHAWWRYNLAFWKPFIESFGYNTAE